jgi:phage gp36-like protein
MPYVTTAQVTAIIPAPVLRDALDDEGTGQLFEDPDSLLPARLAQVLQNASDKVDAFCAARYSTPFASPPKAVVRAALCFAAAAIYARREVPEEKLPPEAKESKRWEELLQKVQDGKASLDVALAPALGAAAGGNPFVPGRIPVPSQGGPLTGDIDYQNAPVEQ